MTVNLTWLHTRTKKPMKQRMSQVQAWLVVLRIRTVYPRHRMQMNGQAV